MGFLADSITMSLQSLQSCSTLRDACRALRLHLDALARAAVTAVNDVTASPLLAEMCSSGVAVGEMGVLRAREFVAQLGSHFLVVAHEAGGRATAAMRDGRVWLQGTAAMLEGVWVPGADHLLVCDGSTSSSPLVYHTLPLRPPVSLSLSIVHYGHRLAICRLRTYKHLARATARFRKAYFYTNT